MFGGTAWLAVHMPQGHSMGGGSKGRKAGKKYSNYTRPAESRGRAKVGKVPKGVQGQSLGAGASRAKAGKKGGCAVLAIVGLGTAVAAMGGAVWAAAEGIRAFV